MVFSAPVQLSELEDIKDLVTIFALRSESFAILVKCVHIIYAMAKVGNKRGAQIVVDTPSIIYFSMIVAVMAVPSENASLMNLSNSG